MSAGLETPARETPAPGPPYVRKPTPFPAQLATGVMMYGVIAPAVWTLEKLGFAGKLLGALSRPMRRNLEKNNPFRGYVPGPQDVFVMTLPKSGTNWMMQIAHQLIWHGKAEYEHIHSVIPWPDTKAMGFMRDYAIPLEQADHWKASPERKRVIKTHFNWEMLPYSEEARYIGIIRDPKDVFVSSYFFIRDGVYGPAMPSVDTWYRMFLSGDGMMGMSWPENAAGYWAQRHRPNVLILSFKALKRDLEGTVRRVADFLDIRVGEEVIQDVCRQSSFEYMKRIDHKFYMGKLIPWREPGAMIRKGTQGGSSELLTPERQREVDAHCQAELKRLGCDLPYEEFCDLAP
jgi:hypothetical protein